MFFVVYTGGIYLQKPGIYTEDAWGKEKGNV